MTAVLIIALAFADAGQGTWAAYLFGTIMLLFVVLGLNQFARRSATAGSMYAYTARGLGPFAGVLSGWSLIWAYMFIAIAGLGGFAIFCGQFLQAIHVHGADGPFFFWAISLAGCFLVAWKDIRLSSMLTLVFEGLSVACILALAAVILFKHGVTIQTSQLKLSGVKLKGMDFAIVICIFSLVGFESATAVGGEAKRPLKDVPRAVIWSLVATGGFMVIMSYVEVYGTRHYGTPLSSITAPLNTLASIYGVSFFKVPVSLGAMASFFALSLSCINAGSRIIFPLAGHGFLPRRLHRTHSTNLTPHTAIAIYMVLIGSIPVSEHLFHTSPLTIFNDAGTCAAFGFLFAYFSIDIAAPFYLRRLGALRRRHVAIAVIGFLLLLVPTVGCFYPAPPWPVNLFPYIFLGWMLVGGTRLYAMHRRQPGALEAIERDLEATLQASEHAAVEHGGAHDALGAPVVAVPQGAIA
jgi:amino acid transporter